MYAAVDAVKPWPLMVSVNALLPATALLARGYGRADVAKVMGGNVMRVLKATIG
jgi:microsomal dipeptidase-like Zn-dependent dipeptidase